MNHRKQMKKIFPYLFLAAFSVFLCWFFVGRTGMFGRRADWLNQHSAIPDYFRKQFYETGQLFPEFAPALGGGQNIYNFSYYGLYNPLLLPSYLLPFVKMGDYLIAASICGLIVSVLLFYYWLGKRGFSAQIRFLVSLMFLLAGPLVYQYSRQIMFVQYMPFLVMSLLGADRCLAEGKSWQYSLGVFLMIMSSYYYSIGGMLALLLYGLCKCWGPHFVRMGVRFLLPMFTAVLMSGILIVPTALVLSVREGGAAKTDFLSLLVPDLNPVRFAYGGYTIGLGTLFLTALAAGFAYRRWSERLLCLGCAVIVFFPVFIWALNGGLYVREKVLIPFLPLLCYLAAVYLEKLQRKEISFRAGLASHLLTVALCLGYCCLSGGGRERQKLLLILAESMLTLMGFLLYSKWRAFLLPAIPSVLCAFLFGSFFHNTNGEMVQKEFYQEVTDPAIGEKISQLLAQEEGLYRLEQGGGYPQRSANVNRIWDTRQWITSIYSSTYNQDYHDFCKYTFQIGEPFRSNLHQPSNKSPLFHKLMGVKYVVAQPSKSKWKVSKNRYAAPVAYASNQIISESAYQELSFPYNQISLMRYAVAEDAPVGGKKGERDALKEIQSLAEPVKAVPVWKKTAGTAIQKKEGGYHIRSDESIRTSLAISARNAQDARLLYLQFDVKNNRPEQDVIIKLNGIQNTLSAQNHYYNENTTFTFVAEIPGRQEATEKGAAKATEKAEKETEKAAEKGAEKATEKAEKETEEKKKKAVEMKIAFGKGDYEISSLRCYLGDAAFLEDTSLYQSEFEPDWEQTKGNRISGKIAVEQQGYLITSIPYDPGFEILLNGKPAEIQKVNTAFLGCAIQAGVHQVDIRYHAPGLAAGKLLSCLGLLLWVASLFVPAAKHTEF